MTDPTTPSMPKTGESDSSSVHPVAESGGGAEPPRPPVPPAAVPDDTSTETTTGGVAAAGGGGGDPPIPGETVDLGDDSSDGLSPPLIFNLDESQEKTRARIATILVILLCGIVGFSFLTVWGAYLLSVFHPDCVTQDGKTVCTVNDQWKLDDLKSMLEIVMSPIVAVVGSVIGFYFGGKK